VIRVVFPGEQLQGRSLRALVKARAFGMTPFWLDRALFDQARPLWLHDGAFDHQVFFQIETKHLRTMMGAWFIRL